MPTLTVAPTSAPLGSTVKVTGTNFKPRITVNLYFNRTRVAKFKATTAGGFYSNVEIPTNAGVGVHTIKAITSLGETSVSVTATQIPVPPPPPPPTGNPSGQAMPTGNLPNFNLVFSDDFTTTVPEGQFPAAVTAKWNAYPYGWDDSPNLGIYDPSIVSLHDSVMDIHIRKTNNVFRIATPSPKIGGKEWGFQLYGRYAIRAEVDPMVGYKGAWLLWPESEVWPRDGEIDFPEGGFDDSISAYMHRQGGTGPGDQDAFENTGYNWQTWHTYVTEWTPSYVKFYVDGNLIGTSTSRIPNTPMGYRIQNETDGTTPPDTAQGHILIDWIAVWSYAPPTTPPPPTTGIPAIPAGYGTVFKKNFADGTLGPFVPQTHNNDHPGQAMTEYEQFVTDSEHISVHDGYLDLKCTRNSNGIWSASLVGTYIVNANPPTRTFDFQYGTVRWMARMNYGKAAWHGLWYWSLWNAPDTNGAEQEIDWPEIIQSRATGNIHGTSYDGQFVSTPPPDGNWHEYKMVKTSSSVTVFTDGVQKGVWNHAMTGRQVLIADCKVGLEPPDATTPSPLFLNVAWVTVDP